MMQFFKENTAWLVGTGENINLLLDNWCGKRVADLLQIPQTHYSKLNSKLSCIISNNQLAVISSLLTLIPELMNYIKDIMVAKNKNDMNVWCPESDCILMLKRAYLHLTGTPPSVS
ncbi:unnamed protein product [Vicia faba]|uniref:Uncharacterized protein n=1 Tax=Vicia faba TaxID=3906 RepID=A0AAV0ZA39_VICFA|nr:unnamed protein product [Vicia faba]